MMFMCPWQTHVLRNVSHWAEIGFWCSINHKQRKTKDIYSVGERKRNQADIMSRSVWMWLKTAITEWEILFLRLVMQNDIKWEHCILCLSEQLAAACSVCWRTDEKAEKYKHEWLQIMRNFWPSFLPSLTLKKNQSIWQTCHLHPTSTAQLADQDTSFLSDRFCFPFQSWSGLNAPLLYIHTPCCPLENEDRCFDGLKQFDLQVLVLFSLAYNSARTETHTRNNRHFVNIWKGTASFRWSQLLYPSYNNSAYGG